MHYIDSFRLIPLEHEQKDNYVPMTAGDFRRFERGMKSICQLSIPRLRSEIAAYVTPSPAWFDVDVDVNRLVRLRNDRRGPVLVSDSSGHPIELKTNTYDLNLINRLNYVEYRRQMDVAVLNRLRFHALGRHLPSQVKLQFQKAWRSRNNKLRLVQISAFADLLDVAVEGWLTYDGLKEFDEFVTLCGTRHVNKPRRK